MRAANLPEGQQQARVRLAEMAAALAKAREKLDRMRKAGAPKRALKAREGIVQGLDNRLRETRAVSERGRSRAAASRREQRRVR